MTLEELVALARTSGWRFVAPGHGNRGRDGVQVLGLQGGRWRVGYRERGVVDWDPGTLTEREAVDVVLRRLRQSHTFEPP